MKEYIKKARSEITKAYLIFEEGIEKDPTVDKIWDAKKEFIRECKKVLFPDRCELCFKHKKAGTDTNICKECAESPARIEVMTNNGETHHFHTKKAVELWVSEWGPNEEQLYGGIDKIVEVDDE